LFIIGQIYYYNQQAHKISRAIQMLPHTYLKKAKMGVNMRLGHGHAEFADLFIMDSTIIVLPWASFFGNIQYQPVQQYFFDDTILPETKGISMIFRDTFIQYYGNKLVLRSKFKQLWFDVNFESSYKIDAENMDIVHILKKHKITVYP
jgi:hypothetical protein